LFLDLYLDLPFQTPFINIETCLSAVETNPGLKQLKHFSLMFEIMQMIVASKLQTNITAKVNPTSSF